MEGIVGGGSSVEADVFRSEHEGKANSCFEKLIVGIASRADTYADLRRRLFDDAAYDFS